MAEYNTDPVSSTHNMPGRRGWHGSQNAETSECVECCFVLLVCAQNFVGELSAEWPHAHYVSNQLPWRQCMTAHGERHGELSH